MLTQLYIPTIFPCMWVLGVGIYNVGGMLIYLGMYAHAAIIKNDSGSTGGGRGAASKKLSDYGFSIKISTDGYIELYINKKMILREIVRIRSEM